MEDQRLLVKGEYVVVIVGTSPTQRKNLAYFSTSDQLIATTTNRESERWIAFRQDRLGIVYDMRRFAKH